MLKFKVVGQELTRVDDCRIIQYARNYPAAEFVFDESWEEAEVIVAQFRKNGTTYDMTIENNKCILPWEVLDKKGYFGITLMGGDLITTNTLYINVYENALIGGMLSTEASPGIYTTLRDKVNNLIESIKNVIHTRQLNADIVNTSTIDAEENNFKIEAVSGKGTLKIGENEGLKFCAENSSIIKNQIEIGFRNEGNVSGFKKGLLINQEGELQLVSQYVGQRIGLVLSSSNGASGIYAPSNDFTINAGRNSNFKIGNSEGYLNNQYSTFEMNVKQLDIMPTKGINIQARDNSYIQTSDRKLILGNNTNQLEFRTDGITKHKGHLQGAGSSYNISNYGTVSCKAVQSTTVCSNDFVLNAREGTLKSVESVDGFVNVSIQSKGLCNIEIPNAFLGIRLRIGFENEEYMYLEVPSVENGTVYLRKNEQGNYELGGVEISKSDNIKLNTNNILSIMCYYQEPDKDYSKDFTVNYYIKLPEEEIDIRTVIKGFETTISELENRIFELESETT